MLVPPALVTLPNRTESDTNYERDEGHYIPPTLTPRPHSVTNSSGTNIWVFGREFIISDKPILSDCMHVHNFLALNRTLQWPKPSDLNWPGRCTSPQNSLDHSSSHNDLARLTTGSNSCFLCMSMYQAMTGYVWVSVRAMDHHYFCPSLHSSVCCYVPRKCYYMCPIIYISIYWCVSNIW